MVAAAFDVRFETFHWVENAAPGISSEPQARINEQANGYDAFISVIGAKIGSPTDNYESGTIEEIENAINCVKNSIFGSDFLMIFFKTVSLDYRYADLESAGKVQKFRKSLSPRGILYKDYDDDGDLRAHIFRCFGRLLSVHLRRSPPLAAEVRSGQQLSIKSPSDGLDPVGEEESDLGMLDYDAIAAVSLKEATDRTEIIANAVKGLGESVSSISVELGTANAAGDQPLVRRLIAKSAEEMTDCADKLEDQAPIIGDLFKCGYDAMISVIEIRSADFGGDSANAEKEKLIGLTLGLIDTILSSQASMSGLRRSVEVLPRMTKEINKAKRRLLRACEGVISMYDDMNSRLVESLNFLQSF
jgi:hypothetical protein